MNKMDVVNFICAANNDTLNELVNTIRFRRAQLTQVAKSALKRGDKVQFTITGRRKPGVNGTWTGTIESVKTKNVKVMATNKYSMYPTRWTVPATMVEKV